MRRIRKHFERVDGICFQWAVEYQETDKSQRRLDMVAGDLVDL